MKTHNEQFQYWSAHFDLTPLKNALRTYIEAYKQSPKSTRADWEALDTLWIKVGLPQREVPAHIAQEYCHPKRSFEDVVKTPALLDASNPANLERQLKIYNWVTGTSDAWFTPASSAHEDSRRLVFHLQYYVDGVTGGGGRGLGRAGRRGRGVAGGRAGFIGYRSH